VSTSDLRRQSWRFLLVGGANTAVTAALMAVLSMVIDPRVAYTVVYVAGLAFTTVMTSRYVFSAGGSWTRMSAFVAWYLAVYAVGLGVVRVLDGGHDWPAVPLALATVAVTAPLSFVGGRLIFGSVSRSASVQEV
jgi:putative flippase GtrA